MTEKVNKIVEKYIEQMALEVASLSESGSGDISPELDAEFEEIVTRTKIFMNNWYNFLKEIK